MIKDGPSSKIDLGNVQGVDAREERAERVQELEEILGQKQELEQQTKGEIRALQQKLAAEKARLPQSNHKLVQEYNDCITDLNVAYDDIITSTKEHLQLNTAIMRKEKEIKELEAKLAFLNPVSSDDEH